MDFGNIMDSQAKKTESDLHRSLNLILESDFDDLACERPDLYSGLVGKIVNIAIEEGIPLHKDEAIIRQLSKLERLNIIPESLYNEIAMMVIKRYRINERCSMSGRSN